jgi:GT2 family glycosyltransferase
MTLRADLVTIYHNEHNYRQYRDLRTALQRAEPDEGYAFISVDNRTNNRGFAGGCNAGAFTRGADAPIIGFLNPDVIVTGPFIDTVTAVLTGPVVITGCRYGKAQRELDDWGVTDWVCGAAFFVTRRWFTAVNGFDTQFVWGWEETDLIRRAQAQNLRCQSIELPIRHRSPDQNSATDAAYKNHYFNLGAKRFRAKWPK